jgi:hypothetical protein
MGKMKWLGAVILTLALLAVMPLAVLAATGISDQGGTVGETEDSLFAILQDGNNYSLYSLPAAGVSMTKLDTAQTLDSLVIGADGTAYYLSGDGTTYRIRHVAADKTITTLVPFDAGVTVKRLSWYDGMLYCLVDNKLTIVDPDAGDQDEVCPLSLSEYVIIDDVVFYISGDDIATYTHEMTDGNMLVTSGGKLYSMTSTGTNSELLLDKGVTDLRAAGDYLYFHNMEDNYAMGSSDDMWLEGKLYRYNIQTGQLTSMNLDYDWDFFPSTRGVVIYTSQDVSLYPLTGGDGKVLMAPELYTTLTVFGDAAYVYEHSSGKLTKVPLDGSAAATLSTGNVVDLTAEGAETTDDATTDETTTDDTATDDTTLTDDTTDTDDTTGDTTGDTTDDTDVSDDSDSGSSGSSSSATSSGYIFPNSSSKKLTRSQILKVSKSKWGYARNEIYARHGYKFKSSKYKTYFGNKTWYKPGSFSTGELNSIEWYNMDLIKSLEVEYGLLNGSTSSGSSNSGATSNSYIFSSSSKKKLTDSQLKNLSKRKLGIARNEILARHGYVFKSSYYKNYFKNQKWYKAGGYSSSKLNDTEWYNIKKIKKWEAKK